MTVTIRILGPTDAALLDDVAAEVFDYPIDPRSTAEFLADPRHHLAVAVENGRVVGMGSAVHYVHPDKPPELWVNEIGVAPTHRREGIGRLVLEALLERGCSLGCHSAWVLSEASDIQARRFYAAVGGQESPAPLVMYEFELSSGGGHTKADSQRMRSEAARESQFAQADVVLELNSPLCNADVADLFKTAWGDQAPDAPPAVERCLAHICAYSNGRLVGFVKLAWDGGIHAFLLDTTVHPDYQRRGIGKKLVARAVEVAADSGIEWLHVDYDQPMGSFYAACGFQPTTAGLINLADRRQ